MSVLIIGLAINTALSLLPIMVSVWLSYLSSCHSPCSFRCSKDFPCMDRSLNPESPCRGLALGKVVLEPHEVPQAKVQITALRTECRLLTLCQALVSGLHMEALEFLHGLKGLWKSGLEDCCVCVTSHGRLSHQEWGQ